MEVDMTDEDWHQVEPDEEYFLVNSTFPIQNSFKVWSLILYNSVFD